MYVKQQQPLDPKLVGSVLWIHRYTINTDACAQLIRPVCYCVLIEQTWEEKTLKFPWTVNEKNTRAIENKNKGNRYIISMPYTFSASNFVLFLNLSERKNFKVFALNDFDSIISYSFSCQLLFHPSVWKYIYDRKSAFSTHKLSMKK